MAARKWSERSNIFTYVSNDMDLSDGAASVPRGCQKKQRQTSVNQGWVYLQHSCIVVAISVGILFFLRMVPPFVIVQILSACRVCSEILVFLTGA